MIEPLGELLGKWAVELNVYSVILRVILSMLLSAVIGCERSSKRHSAGLRTFIIVSLGMTFAMLIDTFIIMNTDFKLYVISGAAVIAIATITVNSILFSSKNQIKGLTTSAGLWTVGLIGLACGAGLYTIAVIGFFAVLICMAFFTGIEKYLKNRSNHFEVHLELESSANLRSFITTIRELGLVVDDIEVNPAYVNSGLSVYTMALSISSPELKKYKTHKEIIEALSTIEYVYHIEELSG